MKYKRFNISNIYKDIYYLNKMAKQNKCLLHIHYPRYRTYVIKKPMSFSLKSVHIYSYNLTYSIYDKFCGKLTTNMVIPSSPKYEGYLPLGSPMYMFLIER